MKRRNNNNNCNRYINSSCKYSSERGLKIKRVPIKNGEIKASEDTQHRIDIHGTIHRLIQNGYGIEKILNELYKKFPDSNYKEYFSKWVEDKIEKNKKATKNKEERQI